jgi:hypothetical protein
MGQCFPGTTRARNTSSWMGYCARTWYPTDAYFQPRVRTSSRRCLPLIDPPRAVVPCRVSVRCRCGKDVRALQRPIECYGIREYKSFLERARGRSSDLSGFRRNGHRSYGNFRPRGRAPSETPYRATGTIHFLAPSFGVAAAFGLSRNVAPGFSYNSGRTTGGIKVSLLDTEVGTIRVTAAAEGGPSGLFPGTSRGAVEALEDIELLAIALVAFGRVCVGKASVVTSSVVRTAFADHFVVVMPERKSDPSTHIPTAGESRSSRKCRAWVTWLRGTPWTALPASPRTARGSAAPRCSMGRRIQLKSP